jgi:DNA-binding MarR family transcriptional regulator
MTCLCANARRAARSLTNLYEQHLAACELTVAQFELLQNLSARPGVSQSDLVSILGVDQTTLSRNLHILIARSWIKRSASKTDARQSTYKLTPTGLRILNTALPAWKRVQQHMRQALGTDFDSALALLSRVQQAASVLHP